ncbi:MAG TPA: hypothetical protein VMU36_02775 [Spirochaetia bacterium]|nr:hypothetical protein [Spirochaetia bacterium]
MIGVEVSTTRALIFATCLVLCAVPVPAVTPQSVPVPPDVLVLINPPSRNTEDFTTLIAEAATYKLGNLGVASKIVSAAPSETDSPLPRAKASGASAALVCRYQLDGGQMVVTLGWYDAESNTSVVVQTRGAVDLHLDDVILAALDDILGKVQTRLSALSARHAGAASTTPAAPAGLTLPPAGGAVQVIGQRPPASPVRHRVLLSGGFAPFVPTGAASYYFALGYLPSLLASLFIDTPVGPVGLGLYAGMDYFKATGFQDYSDTYLIPLGIDVRYELGSAALRPFFHVTGGPALLVMVTGAQGTITNVLPFLKSGIGLDVLVTQGVSVSAVADYDVYFELPYLLMGFSPSMNFELHL